MAKFSMDARDGTSGFSIFASFLAGMLSASILGILQVGYFPAPRSFVTSCATVAPSVTFSTPLEGGVRPGPSNASQPMPSALLVDVDPLAGHHLSTMSKSPFSPEMDRGKVFSALVTYIEKAAVAGDYVETGVWRGGSAAAVAKHLVCKQTTPQMKMYLYDAWQGMPATTAEDGAAAQRVHEQGWGKPGGNVAPASLEDALRALNNTGIDIEQGVVIRKGWFNETFKLEKPKSVAFLHVDSDWYHSVLDTLETFYDLVPVGGVVLFDDFGFWEGCRRAVWDFFSRRNEHPLLERVGVTQAYFIKGKEHNRDSSAINHWEESLRAANEAIC